MNKADYERALKLLNERIEFGFEAWSDTQEAIKELKSLIEDAFRWREALEEINEVPRSVGCYDRMKAIAQEALKEGK